MAIIELNKKQCKEVVDGYVEEMSTEELEKFIIKLIKNYGGWLDADMNKIANVVNKLKKDSEIYEIT